jgi:hypothetical protein
MTGARNSRPGCESQPQLCIDHYRRRRREEQRVTDHIDPDMIPMNDSAALDLPERFGRRS